MRKEAVRLAVVGHTYTVAHNRTKLALMRDQLMAEGGDLVALVPRTIVEPWGTLDAAIRGDEAHFVIGMPAIPRGRPTARLFAPGWSAALDRFAPTHLHVEEEPYSLITGQVGMAARRRGIPFSFFSWENLERPITSPQRAVESWVCSWADRAIAGSIQAAMRLSARMSRAKIEVCPQLGVQVALTPRVQSPVGRLKVIYVGRLVEEKGIMDLVTATRQASVQLTVMGAGPLEGRLRSIAHDGSLAVLPAVSHGLVGGVIREHDVLVLPSRPTATWAEQFGHVLIEAMAQGVIPVGARCGAIPEVIRDNSLVFDPGDVAGLAHKLSTLAGNRPVRVRLGAEMHVRAAAHYSHDVIAERTVALTGAGPAKRAITLVADSLQERRVSMNIYADRVSTGLQAQAGLGGVRVLQPAGLIHRRRIARKVAMGWSRYWTLPRVLARCDSGVVHVLDQTYAHLLPACRGEHLVVSCHDLTPLAVPGRSVGRILYRRAVQQIQAADVVVTPSETTRREVVARLGIPSGRIVVIPYGVAPEFLEGNWSGLGGSIRLLHVGSNADYKRVDIVIGAAVALKARGFDVEMWKVGEPLPGRLARRLVDATIPFSLYHQVEIPHLVELYERASFLVFPSSAEGFGMPVIEALAVGLPVVGSAAPSVVEAGHGAAAHVDSQDPGAYADCISALIGSPQSILAMSAAGKVAARAHRWSVYAARLTAVYDGLHGLGN